MTVITDEIKLKPSEHTQVIARKLLGRFWWLFFVPPVAFSLAALTVDTKFLFLIPIFIFLVYPMLILWGYSIASLSREAVESVVRHKFEISEKGIRYIPIYEDETPFEEINLKEYLIEVDDIVSIEHESKKIVVYLNGNAGRILIIPVDRLPFNTNIETILLATPKLQDNLY